MTEMSITTTGSIARHEIAAYAKTAERGDVLPACMRLVSARADGAWADRTSMAMVVGPACRRDALDMACAFMPRASEPRLLRAAAAMQSAARAGCTHERDRWLAAARCDLDAAARLDPNDLSARVLLAELVRSLSWGRRAA